jgi:hypothetical protein
MYGKMKIFGKEAEDGNIVPITRRMRIQMFKCGKRDG